MTDYNKYKKLDQKRLEKRKKATLKRVYQKVTDRIITNMARTSFYYQLNNIQQICHNKIWGGLNDG